MAGTAIWTGPNAAQIDGNQNPTMMFVAGTLGTADTKGTAAPIRWGGNPLTNAGYVEVIGTVTTTGGAGGGTTVTVDHGTITLSNPAGTTNNIATGTINLATVVLNSGTINVGTFVNNGGTIAVVQNAGTIATGVNTIGNIGTLIAGTINSATAVLNSGTINVGTFVNNGGTVAVIQNAGTLQTGVNTIGNIGTLIAGTINSATAVLNSGTITTAQINPKPVTNPILNVGVTGTTGVGTLITAAAVGAGTSVYVAGYEILVISGTPEVCLAFGTQVTGNQVISHGLFPAGGGVTRKDLPSTYGTTNTALTYQIVSGAGTVSWKVSYWIGV